MTGIATQSAYANLSEISTEIFLREKRLKSVIVYNDVVYP